MMKRFTLKGFDGIRCDLFDGDVELAEVHKEDAKELCNLLNELNDENIVLKQEVKLLRSGLRAYDDNLPVYLTCKEVMDFHSDVYDFKKKEQSFYKEHPNRCKIIVDGVELK